MASSSHPGPIGPGGSSRTPPGKNVGEPWAGEPHARFDGRELETEHADHGHRGGTAARETGGTQAPGPTSQPLPPRQLPPQPSSGGFTFDKRLEIVTSASVGRWRGTRSTGSRSAPTLVIGTSIGH